MISDNGLIHSCPALPSQTLSQRCFRSYLFKLGPRVATLTQQVSLANYVLSYLIQLNSLLFKQQ